MKWPWLTVAASLLLAACQAGTARPGRLPMQVQDAPAWQNLAAAGDLAHIRDVRAAWNRGLAAARADGFARRMAAEGALLDPEAALPRPSPTPGAYLCRLVRLGAAERGDPAFAAFRPFYCFVGIGDRDDRLSITKSEGSARPAGYLWEDEDRSRLIFLGALAPGSGPVPAYGDNPARDIAGTFERIGPFRWRLVIPRPASGAAMEIFEMEPAEVQADP